MAVATDGLNLLQPVIQFPGPGGLSHRVVSRVPLHVPGYHGVEGYPCAHLQPVGQLVGPGAVAQPKVVCHHVAGVGQRHVLEQNGDSRPPSVLNPDPVDGGGEALSLPHEGGQAVTHLSCAAAAIPRPPAPACRRATGTSAGPGRCRSARTSCGPARSGAIRPAVAGSAAARSTDPRQKLALRPAPRLEGPHRASKFFPGPGGPFFPGLNLREGRAVGGAVRALRDRRTSGDTVYSFKGDTPSPWVEVSNGRGAGLTLALPRPSFTLKSGLQTGQSCKSCRDVASRNI